MLIDWFTVVAQIVNFLILVFLLKYFLYDRVIRAMDAREEKVRLRLEEADQKRQDAELQSQSYDRKLQELEQQRKQILAEAREEAEQRRKQLTEEVRNDVESMRTRWQDALRREQESFLRRLRQMTGSHVFRIVRQTLHDLTDADLEDRIIRSFLRQLGEASAGGDPTGELQSILGDGNSVTIRSSFELPPHLREEMTTAVRKLVGDGVFITFETDLQATLGIELTGNGRKIAWSVDEYLNTLEEQARKTLDGEAKAPAEPSPVPIQEPDSTKPGETS